MNSRMEDIKIELRRQLDWQLKDITITQINEF